MRQRDELKQANQQSPAAKLPEPPKQPDVEEQNQRDRLANQVAALEANKARLAEQRVALEHAMTERLMKAQSDREQAEQRLEIETARLPPVALEAKTVATQTRQKSTPSCKEINARAQLGDISETDRVALRQCH